MGRKLKCKEYRIDSIKRDCILNVYNYFLRDNQKFNSISSKTQIRKKVSDALCISYSTVVKVVASHNKEIKVVKEPKSKIDDFDKQLIRRTIHKFYAEKVFPSAPMIQDRIKDDVEISLTGLRTILNELGFCWRKTTDDRRVAIEKTEAAAARAQFLRAIKKYRENGYKIIYVDETWVNQNHTKSYSWLPKLQLLGIDANKATVKALPKTPSGKGKRLIVLHAGSEDGFVEGMDLVFVGQKGGDYHQEMNSVVFLEWFEQLCTTLSGPSCIVLDNASYHNSRTDECICPTSATNKAGMQQWLNNKNIAFNQHLTKPELYEIIKHHKPPIKYKTDDIAAMWGHAVLRTPVRQCEFNAIELIWALLKNFIVSNNTTFRLTDIKQMVIDRFDTITPNDWRKCVLHTIKVEDQYRKSMGVMDDIEPVIINLDSDDSSNSDDSEDDNLE